MEIPARWLSLALVPLMTLLTPIGRAAGSPRDGDGLTTLSLRAVGQGAVHLRSGDLFLACYRFREAVDLAPEWPMARFELGRCLRLLGDPHREARSHLQRAIAQQPRRQTFYLALGRLAEDQGDLEAARATYQRAARLSPLDRHAQMGLARLATSAEGQAALERLRREIAVRPHDRAARRLHAHVAASLGANVEAEESFRWLLEHSRDRCRAAAALWAFGVSTAARSAINDGASACK